MDTEAELYGGKKDITRLQSIRDFKAELNAKNAKIQKINSELAKVEDRVVLTKEVVTSQRK